MDGIENPEKKPRPVSGRNGQPIPVSPGRPKGVQNKATSEFKGALNNLLETAAPHMVEWLAEIKDPEKRFDILAKFAEYIHPKLGRVEQNITGQVGVTVNWPLNKSKLEE